MAMRDWFIKDLGWKLFSLTLAVAIWLTVKSLSGESTIHSNPLGVWDTRTVTNLPVSVLSSAADVREFKVVPEVVQVTVSGRPEVLNGLDPEEIQVIVNLKDIEAARGLRKRVNVSAPAGVALVRVVPEQVDVVIPPKRDKKS